MRKLLFDPNYGTTLPPQLSPSPSQSSYYIFPSSNDDANDSFYNNFLPPAGLPVVDIATVSIITLLLLLSLLSLLFLFHLRVKSQCSHHLQNFSTSSSVRLLLVIFVCFWATNEILRLPFYRQRYTPLNLPQQANRCKIYVVCSLGLFEPGFLATFLYLVRISVKKCNYKMSVIITNVGSMCLPVFLGQIFVVFFSPFQAQLPETFYRSSVISEDFNGDKNVLCTYPFSSTIVFTGFGALYTLGFSLSCWKVLSVVINKSITKRINILALTIMTSIPLQSVFLALSSLWSPGNAAFEGVIIAMFLSAAVCAMVGLCILVIKPTADALAAQVQSPPEEVEKKKEGEEYREQS